MRPILAIKPENLYIEQINIITSIIPIRPEINVLFKEFSPNEASTVLEDNSTICVGNAPELIKSVNFLASSLVKLPCIITSLAKACSTLAADKHLELPSPQFDISSTYLSPS